ncbi:MAG TPA: carbohydrate ABC transporter permease, partial [Candidatus Faecivicinus avistercoris]|nr:carbohydrate ABC transporter permease [Candidatus Faecivicinus avistercoris]
YALLIFISCICIVPLYWMFRSSLMSNGEIFQYPPLFFPESMRWDNYRKAFESFDAVKYFGNTLKILIPCVLGTVLTSAMAGYALARVKFPGRKVWFALVVCSMILPGHVTLIPQYITYSKLGMINTYWPFYFAAWFGGGATNVFLMRQFMMTLPRDYDEAAYLDGANRVQIFTRIILPMIVPILITVSIFSFMGYWNDFQGPLIYLQTDDNFTLALGMMQFRSEKSNRHNLMMAAGMVMVVPAIILYGVGQKYFIEGINLTGIKG